MPEQKPYNIDDLFVPGSIPQSFTPPVFSESASLQSAFSDGIDPGVLGAGEFIGQNTVQAGYLQSSNFVTGSAGWQLTAAGNLEASSGTFRGTITASAGTIGGFDIGSDYVRDVANSFGLASTVTGGDDVRFWAGDTFANRATADFRVTEAGTVTATDITATGTINATGGYAGASTALAVEAGGYNVGTTGHMRGGQTDYDTGTGWFIGYSGGAYKLSMGVGASTTNSLTWDGTTLTVNGYAITGKGNFGGNGADGALTITSGTTTVSAASAALFFKNYTSISITGTGVLAFSNPHANGTFGIIKSKGAVTITSSATPAFDGTGMGAAGVATNTANAAGSNGSDHPDILDTSNHYGAGGGHYVDGVSAGVGGAAGAAVDTTAITNLAFPYTLATTYLYRQKVHLQCGSGGGSGAGDGGGDEGGLGGRGAGGFLIECGGAWNFTTTNGISVAGIAGGNSVNGDSGTSGNGGGGGGGGGHFVALYNSLTANTGTISISGGNGGTGSNSLSGSNYGNAGGGGGAGVVSAGGAGGNGGAPNNNGVDGSAGSGASGGTGGAKGTSDGSSSGGGGGGGGGGMGTSLVAENLYYA